MFSKKIRTPRFFKNGRTDFRHEFAEFQIFSGPCNGHTDLPSKKKTHGHGLQSGIPWPSLVLASHVLTVS